MRKTELEENEEEAVELLEPPGYTGGLNNGKEQRKKGREEPYTVVDVLEKVYHQDFKASVSDFVGNNQVLIEKSGDFKGAKSIRVISCYVKALSSIVRQPVENTVVDVIVEGKLRGDYYVRQKDSADRVRMDCEAPSDKERLKRLTSYCRLDFRLRYCLDLRPDKRTCSKPDISIVDKSDRSRELAQIESTGAVPANKYLLPIMRSKDYDRVGSHVMREYYPEFRDSIQDFVIDGEELADRMGLTVRDVHFADDTVMGMVFFASEEVMLLDSKGKPFPETISLGVILISKDHCKKKAVRNGTIVHECAHYYLDTPFFMLQMIMGRKCPSYASRTMVLCQEKVQVKNDLAPM